MYKLIMVTSACLMPVLGYSSSFHHSPKATAQLIVAFHDDHPTTGSDRDTVLFPNPVLDTVRTRDTGTETFSKDSPPPEITPPPPPTNDEPPPAPE